MLTPFDKGAGTLRPSPGSPFPADELLRPDVPLKPSFSVSEVPHRAKLDQNESPFEPPAEVKRAIVQGLEGRAWNRYPQPRRYAEVKERFAAALGLAPQQVVLTAGCDQVILLAFWAAGGPGRRARIFEPTYPMFGYYGRITGTTVDRVVLDADFDLAAEGLGSPVDLLCLVSPNNPTGDGPDRALILEALQRRPRGLVLVDEAYADYARSSVVDLLDAHPNLLVGRSLSKAMLAGVRLGYAVGHPELITALENLLFVPYHLSALQLEVAWQLDQVLPHLERRVDQILAERERVDVGIRALGCRTYPSRANFVLFEVGDAAATYAALLERGVRLRDVSGMPGLGQHLRVTIGTDEENAIFLDALADALK
jgi:histidinol-phosphate aminotransferase